MKIEISNDQYRMIIKGLMVYGAIRAELDENVDILISDESRFIENLEEHLLSYAKAFDALDLVEENSDGRYVPAEELYDINLDLLDEYIDDRFWGEFIDRITFTEWIKTASKDELSDPNILPRKTDRYRKIHDKYADEISENGLNRIGIVKK